MLATSPTIEPSSGAGPTENTMKPNRHPIRTASLLALATCLPLVAAGPAQAGPVEQLVEVVFAPGDSPVMVARYLNGGGGLLYSEDRGQTWQLQCGSAMAGPGVAMTGPTAILGNGSIVVRSSGGILVGDSKLCAFQNEVDKTGGDINDFAVDPRDPDVLFAARGTRMDTSKNGLVRRAADGTWSELSVQADRTPVSLRVVKRGDGVRVYMLALKVMQASTGAAGSGAAGSGAAGSGAAGSTAGPVTPEYVIRVSDDEGATWMEHPLMVADGTPRMRGADPSNPDRIVLVSARTTAPDDVLVSLDAGATTSVYMQVVEFGGVAWAPDGKVWIGDLGGSGGAGLKPGLYGASSLAAPATKLPMAEYAVQCLGYRESDSSLIACQRFWMGSVDGDTGAFTFSLRLTEVGSFVTCADGAGVPATCEQQLCADYCGPAHFAIAPVCSAYDKPGCGVPVALEEGSMMSSADGGVAGSGSGATSAPPPLAAGSGSAGTAAAAGASGAAAGSGATAGSTPPESSGCSCSVPGGSSDASRPWLLGAFALLALAWTRRRRSPSSRARCESSS